jgi:methyltransferase-like protein
LEEINEPCTFKQFVDDAARHNLTFLAEADLPSMVLDNQPAQTAKKIREISGNQLVGSEQMLDILNGRTFRQSLLVKAEVGVKIDRNLTAKSVDTLHFITAGDIKVKRTEKGGEATDAAGRRLVTEHKLVIDAVEKLAARHPASASVADLVDDASTAAQKEMVREALLRMGLSGLCTFISEPVAAATREARKPVAIELARTDAQMGEAATTNLRHERVSFDALGQFVLPLLDGTRDLAAVAELVVEAARIGRLNFDKDGVRVADPGQLAAIAGDQVRTLVGNLGKTALLQA